MIIGIGTDLVNITRIDKTLKRHGLRFEKRCFSANEIAQAKGKKPNQRAAFYAKRFAAKEALVKALGTGFINDIYLRDIEVTKDDLGRPELKLSNGVLNALEKSAPKNMNISTHLSLSDDNPYASAFVIIEVTP